MAGAFPDEPGAPPGAGSLNMFRDDSLHQKRQVRSSKERARHVSCAATCPLLCHATCRIVYGCSANDCPRLHRSHARALGTSLTRTIGSALTPRHLLWRRRRWPRATTRRARVGEGSRLPEPRSVRSLPPEVSRTASRPLPTSRPPGDGHKSRVAAREPPPAGGRPRSAAACRCVRAAGRSRPPTVERGRGEAASRAGTRSARRLGGAPPQITRHRHRRRLWRHRHCLRSPCFWRPHQTGEASLTLAANWEEGRPRAASHAPHEGRNAAARGRARGAHGKMRSRCMCHRFRICLGLPLAPWDTV